MFGIYNKYLLLSEFPDCCGINIVSCFHYLEDDFELSDKEERKEAYEIAKKELKIIEEAHKKDTAGLLLVALADYQRKYWHPFLLKNKYKPIMQKIRNPRHKSYLTLYAKRTPKN